MSHSINASPVKSGDVLASKYRVDRVLGVGGMGVVVSAVHIELDQLVALKFLHPDAATKPDLIERFVREARASVRLKSPHVAKTLDVGRLDDGRPYIVMELLEGQDLDAELRSMSDLLPIEDAASYVLQACDALAEAHALGIVHRDLKPANLFLTHGPDGRAHVKVFDFGISKFLDEPFVEGRTPSSLTRTEAVFGSPAYMSPEQMRSSRDVDERTDIWALGVILYELLTMRIPFEAQSAIEMGLKVVQDAPTPPRTYRPDIPEELEQVILRCLTKDLSLRFADVGELATALAPFANARDRGIAARATDIIGARQRSGKLPTSSRSLIAPPSSPSDRAIAAWGTTHISPPTNRSSRALWLALAGVLILGGGVIAVGLFWSTPPTGQARGHASATSAVVDESRMATPAVLSPANTSAAPVLELDEGVSENGADASVERTTIAHSARTSTARPANGAAATKVKAGAPASSEDAGTFFRVRE